MFSLLERAGWEPLLCDTPVQCYDIQVPAGLPNGVGDPVRLDDQMFPHELVRMETYCSVIVRGDSMKDAGILNGDRVQFRMDGVYSDGDIVVALTNVSLDEEQDVTVNLEGAAVQTVSGRILTSANVADYNDFENPDRVAPADFTGAQIEQGVLSVKVPAKSLVVLTLK